MQKKACFFIISAPSFYTTILHFLKLQIVHGASTGKEFFLRVLGEQVDGIKPILLETDQNDIVFFIDDDEV